MTLTEEEIKNIIRKLLRGEDYRIVIVNRINTSFLQFTIEFFTKIVAAKLKNKDLTIDWYKKEFLSNSLNPKDVAINSGLNMKTITNMHNSASKEVVLEVAHEHYDHLYQSIENLIDENDIDLTLTIKFKEVSVELSINESLIVINALAVKRAALRGGNWSTAGKSVEKPLMETLCRLYEIPEENYSGTAKSVNAEHTKVQREVDFYLFGINKEEYKCEVKLMGKGNPESADGALARKVHIFIADKLSLANKKELEESLIEWVALRDKDGFKKFEDILEKLEIPHTALAEDFEQKLDGIFKEIF